MTDQLAANKAVHPLASAKTDTAHIILDCLIAEGVGHVFGLPGSSFLEFLDAFHETDEICFVGVHHEQSAAHMADGYARAKSGRNAGIGVCIATSGPGVTNLVTGVAMAQQACTPLLVIGGSVTTGEEYRDSKQELDQLNLFRPITKAVLRITRADRAAELIRHAVRVAMSGQRGPVYVDIPKDVFQAESSYTRLPPSAYRPIPDVAPAPAAIAEAVALLRLAKRPLIVAGAEFKSYGGSDDLAALAETFGIPVVASSGHRDILANDHPMFFGQIGQRGTPIARELGRSADLILTIGTRLGYNTSVHSDEYLNREAKLIQCCIDAREIGRHFPLALGFVADAGSAVRALLGAARRLNLRPDWHDWNAFASSKRDEWIAERELALNEPAIPIRSSRLYAELRRAAPKDLRVVLDAGYWGGRGHDAFDFLTAPRFHTSLDFRCVGAGLSVALGVQFAEPKVPLLCIHGDGGFAMTSQELETALRFGLNPVVVVLNNYAWGAEKRHQKQKFGGRFVGSEFDNPRFDRLAETFGCVGHRVERADEIGDLLREAWKSPVPTVLDVIVDPEEL